MPRKGYKISEQHRQNISKGKTGVRFTEEHKENIGKGMNRRYEQFPKQPWGNHTDEAKQKISDKNGKAVNQYTRKGLYLTTWPSMSAAAEALDVHQPAISLVVRGKASHTGGYIFRFASEVDGANHLQGFGAVV